VAEELRPHGGEPHPRLRDLAAAAASTLLAFAAVPAALVLAVGNPLGGGLGHTWATAPRVALCVLVAAAWTAWAACCVELSRAVAARVRSGEVRTHRGAPLVDRLAARIAVGVLALTSLGGGTLAAASAVGATTPPAGQSRTVDPALRAEHPAPSTHRVVPGDTLWRIAQAHFEDGSDWAAIAALNLGEEVGAPEGAGVRLVDPDHLRAGWTLRLPGGARPSASGGTASGVGDRLPELVALGLGSLGCAALARRARRRRRRPFVEDPRTAVVFSDAVLSDAAVDTAVVLDRFDGVPALAAFESANLLLASVHVDARSGPRVRAVSVDADGVTFWLAHPGFAPRPPFETVAEGTAWRVTHTALAVACGSEERWSGDPAVPLAFPVGDDGQATW
jgi:hypothetical protein